MILTGTYHRSLDEKKRLAIPKRLREELGDSGKACLFIAPDTDQALSIYTESTFEALAGNSPDSLKDPVSARNLLRLRYSRAARLELDGQGRIRIPERLVEFARLQTDVVLLGVRDHVELWDQEHWNSFLESHGQEFDDLANRALM